MVQGPGGEPSVVADGLVSRTPPAWSPDGRSLAYLVDGGLVVGTLDGTASRVAACRPPACLGLGGPAWSPDGDAIAFGVSGDRGDVLALVDAGGATRMQILTDLVVEGAPAWSPDGGRIAVPSGDRIVVVDADDGSVATSIAFDGDLGERISWSPDGTTFAVAGRSDGETGVFLVPADGGPATLLTACQDEACVDLDPAWSPDGTEVVFTRGRCDVPGGDCFTGDVFAIAVAGGEPIPLVDGPELDCCGAWQPVPRS
jgi:Tol biopolymer transport system component